MKLSEIYAGMGTEAPAHFGTYRELDDPHVLAHFVVDGDPLTKGRPRFTRTGRVYTDYSTKQGEQQIAWHFRQAQPGWTPNKDDAYGVVAIFFCATRHRRDVDNMLKLILDGLNGVAWVDDMQVSEVTGRVVRGSKDDARTEVVVYHVPSQPRPTRKCLNCGKDFPAFDSQIGKRKFCEAKCGYEYRTKAKTRTCKQCKREFVAHGETHGTQFCSRQCTSDYKRTDFTCLVCGTEFTQPQSIAHRTRYPTCSIECRETLARERRVKNAKGTCSTCGGPTSKKQYTNCAGCDAKLHKKTNQHTRIKTSEVTP